MKEINGREFKILVEYLKYKYNKPNPEFLIEKTSIEDINHVNNLKRVTTSFPQNIAQEIAQEFPEANKFLYFLRNESVVEFDEGSKEVYSILEKLKKEKAKQSELMQKLLDKYLALQEKHEQLLSGDP